MYRRTIMTKRVRTEEWKKYQKEYNTLHPWATKPIKKRLMYNAKKRSKDENVDFNITEDDLIVPEYCPYLDIKLESSQPRGCSRRFVASLDRIDPTKGYIKGNIEVISHLANTMKNNATPEQLIKFAKEVLKRYE